MTVNSATGQERSPGFHAIGLLDESDGPLASPKPVRHSVVGGRHLWLVCAFLVVTTLVAGSVVIGQLRHDALNGSRRALNTLGIVLAEQTSRAIQSVDLVLSEVQSHVSELGPLSPEQFRSRLAGENAHQFLGSHLRNLPQAYAIVLVDAKGAMLNWSRDEPVPQVDFSDRDYFRHLSEQNDPDAFISGPTKGRVTGRWLMLIVRRISGPDGAFLGLVAGLIETQYLEDFYRTINLVRGETVTVLRRDGIVIAGYPDIAHRLGRRMPDESPWYARVAEGGGSYRSPGYLTTFPQIITVHPLRDYPLVVDANMSEQAALANWYKQAAGIAASVIGVAAGLTILFAVIIAQFRRQERQNAKLSQGEIALRESERRLKAFAEMSADWFWEQDADLRFVRDSKIPLTSSPTDVGKTRWDFADPAMNQLRWGPHKADLEARRPFRDFRFERFGTDGKRHYLSTSGDPIFDETGAFLGYHGTGRDITADVEAAEELRLAKDRAEAANRAKSEFLTNMSHELRTPLHVIIGFSELIHDRTGGRIGDNYVAWAGDILASGRHLLGMINQVLDLSKIESGRYDVSDDNIDLAVVARSCVGMVRRQADASQVRIDCMIEDVVLLADLRAMTQILLNLLANSVKFTPGGGVVSMRTEAAKSGGIAIVVADTGIGVDSAALASLGEPFTQADGSINREYGGTGLGLTISRKLAALQDGTLTIESAKGQGTTVRVIFPAARVVSRPRSATAAAPLSV